MCDGQTISADDYPELVAALGSNVLPNLNGRVLQGGSTAGEYKEAGLPNITGFFKVSGPRKGGLDSHLGAFYHGDSYGSVIARDDSWPDGYENSSGGYFDASRSNPIYGASSTVQPPAYTVRYYICYG